MRFAGDNLILNLFTQAYKVGVAAGHAHQKVAVLFRVFLRLAKGVRVNYVNLQTGASHFAISA